MIKLGSVEARPHQEECHNETISFIREQFKIYKDTQKTPDAFIIDASVGFGKSINISLLANHVVSVGWKMLVLSRQGEIIDQNAEALWNCGVNNSIYSASIGRKSTHYNVVCGTEGTVANDLDSAFKEWIPDVIAIDEAHMVDINDILSGKYSTQYGKIIKHFYSVNPRLIICGFTGSPFRGVMSIIGDFWKKVVYRKGTEDLVEMGFLSPTIFGWPHDDIQYHMEEFDDFSETGTGDFSAEQMAKMARKSTKDATLTQKIIMDVIELTKDRNGVLITCASKRHCEQAAEFLPKDTWAIITDDTGYKSRKAIITKAKKGEIKYLLQIGCLTTGFDAPIIDTSVLLRRIGSLTLLVQLLGRGQRILKKEQIESGLIKNDHLVLDYSGTMDAMGPLYSDPILERAKLDKDKKENKDLKECPICGLMNSPTARRCLGAKSKEKIDELKSKQQELGINGIIDKRCEFFWSSKACPHCKTENDQAASVCRNPECRKELIDPNAKLSGTHYKSTDWKKCTKLEMIPCKNNGVLVKYHYIEDDGSAGVADIFYSPFGSDGAKRIWQQQFVYRHIQDWSFRGRAMAIGSAEAVCRMKSMFTTPDEITHRINDKGKHVIHGMKFSNRTLMGNKESKGE